jgi:carbon storage regulator
MLVLSRRAEQSVVIGGSAGFERTLKVTVLEIKGSQVRLGFEADADVPVHRWEIWERILACARADGPTAGLTASDAG